MPYNSLISADDAAALIPDPHAQGIIKAAIAQSAALSLFRRVNMSTTTLKQDVLSALPTAYWRNGPTGLIQSSAAAWANKTLTAEELAVIVPIPKNVLADASYDIWAEIAPNIAEALAIALDSSVFFGVNKPSSWPDSIATMASASNNSAIIGTNSVAQGGIAEDINDTMATVEADGFDVNGFFTSRTLRTSFRSARDANGQRLLDVDPAGEKLFGQSVYYGAEGGWPSDASTARLICGDFTKGIIGIRKDISFEMSDQGVIQDGNGAIVYNLLQQRMVAMIVTARFGFQVANPVTRNQSSEEDRCPFGLLEAAG